MTHLLVTLDVCREVTKFIWDIENPFIILPESVRGAHHRQNDEDDEENTMVNHFFGGGLSKENYKTFKWATINDHYHMPSLFLTKYF